MEKTWRGTWAGILTIIAGCYGIGMGAIFATIGELVGIVPGMERLGALGGGVIAFGVIALIAGIFALRRKAWGFALTSAILAIICGGIFGILATIFVSMGRREFA